MSPPLLQKQRYYAPRNLERQAPPFTTTLWVCPTWGRPLVSHCPHPFNLRLLAWTLNYANVLLISRNFAVTSRACRKNPVSRWLRQNAASKISNIRWLQSWPNTPLSISTQQFRLSRVEGKKGHSKRHKAIWCSLSTYPRPSNRELAGDAQAYRLCDLIRP